ncbi:MAG: hypothetical protein HOL37_02055 [Rhodospirillaceae bacterium]|jgi:hypothetical protein|nr:hypothetical protein [Rhodospirillaceae bacterium]MBT4218813.1 hypothetical protein [Rhodospirillaceae bacterium]MBT4463796.1 hypothetical protein [Rhodospirillaceae bacterium]MBT5013418.1 hypothetical protein [Rhodospirillaceae bacterium]MBT5308095.1 hypothetical protein [Rhodospirillaceae bacterium]
MPTITPPPPALTQAAMPTPPPLAVVQNPPVAITQLSLGHVLEAALTAQVGKDLYTLKTPLGQLTVQTTLPLPKLSNLVLHLQSLTPQAQFVINSINGKPPEGTLRPTMAQAGQAGQTATANTASASPAAGPLTLNAGTTLQASLLRPLAQPAVAASQATGTVASQTLANAPGNTPGTSTGAGFTEGLKQNITKGLSKGFGNLASRVLPAGNAAKTVTSSGKTASTTAAKTAQASHSAQAAGSTGNAKGTQYLSSGTQFSIKIGKIVLPSATATDATPAAPKSATSNLSIGRTLTGTVSGTTTTGHPIVQTNSGVFALKTPAALPRGSIITFDITTPPIQPKAEPGVHLGLGRENLFMSRKWPALEETVTTIHEASPASAQQIVQNILPRPGPALTATVLFFLTALRGGDMRAWLGEAPVRTIERTRPNLHSRLNDDFQTLGRISDDSAKGDWRVALIPINSGEALEQIRMLMRNDENDDEESSEKSNTRFIIDVILSRMGRIQLDGLVRDEGKKLDLIVRTEMPLTDEIRYDIQEIFQNSSEAFGLSGGVGFQAAPPNFIDVDDPISNEEMGLVV